MATSTAGWHDGPDRGGRSEPAPERRSARHPVPGADGGVGELVDELRRVAAALPAFQPDPSEGLIWAHYDAALSGLYGAILALGEVQRLATAGVGPLPPVERAGGTGRTTWHAGRANGSRAVSEQAVIAAPPAIA